MSSSFKRRLVAFALILTLNFGEGGRLKKPKKPPPSDAEVQQFQSWKQRHQKVYQTTFDERRAMANMLRNVKEIDRHNELFKQGKVTFSRAPWENSDLDFDEKLKTLTGFHEPANMSALVPPESKVVKRSTKLQPAPDEVDWVAAGLVHPVRNQGKCGSCWSFTAVGVLEGALLRRGIRTRLSEQNLVDCSRANLGCDGGDAFIALRYVRQNGIASLESYPYTARDGRCQSKPKVDFEMGTLKFERLRGNEKRLKDIVANYGPVGVAIDATDSFMNYRSGVYNNPRCSRRANHAMLLVGYGRDAKTNLDYWLVKNSWGTSWGENGYVKMVRNRRSQCAIALEAVYII